MTTISYDMIDDIIDSIIEDYRRYLVIDIPVVVFTKNKIKSIMRGLVMGEDLDTWLTNNLNRYAYKDVYAGRTLGANTTIKRLIDRIIAKATRDATAADDSSVTPWDIQNALIENLNQIEKTDEIEVNMMGYKFKVGQEFIGGILVFRQISQTDINITIENIPIADDYLTDRNTKMGTTIGINYGSRFLDNNVKERTKYGITAGGIRWRFNDPKFMQGFITGAQWKGVDHRKYWSNLTEYVNSRGGIVETALTI
jgi:hypothetical protein